MNQTYFREPYHISTDPARLDLDLIHYFLAHESYWAKGISRAIVERAIAHSLNFGLYTGTAQVGFARVVTDYATMPTSTTSSCSARTVAGAWAGG